MHLLCAFDFDFGEGDVDVVRGKVLSENTSILGPLVDVGRRCLGSIRLARKLLESVLHGVLNLLKNIRTFRYSWRTRPYLKAKFHYAIWSQTGSKLLADLLSHAGDRPNFCSLQVCDHAASNLSATR